MHLNEISKQIHENAKAKGFWDKDRNHGEMLMLIVSEVSEAMEADRKDNYYESATRYRKGKDITQNGRYHHPKIFTKIIFHYL
jgi:hypothetical protein